ncbi:MAG TPA: DUF397 domain-containing protein [Streptosporangiales bacterium]
MSRPVKPTVRELGIDVDAVAWQRSGDGGDPVEIAFVGEWVLMRAGDRPAGQVLVFDHAEWDAFVRGVKDHEFDAAGERDTR